MDDRRELCPPVVNFFEKKKKEIAREIAVQNLVNNKGMDFKKEKR